MQRVIPLNSATWRAPVPLDERVSRALLAAQLLFICRLAICADVLRWFVIQKQTDGASIAVRHSLPKG